MRSKRKRAARRSRSVCKGTLEAERKGLAFFIRHKEALGDAARANNGNASDAGIATFGSSFAKGASERLSGASISDVAEANLTR